MRKNPVLIKVFAALILVMGLFHFSGAETAFCKDGVEKTQAASHGCVQCHSGQHAAAIRTSTSVPLVPKLDFLQLSNTFLRYDSPSLVFFRPPISA